MNTYTQQKGFSLTELMIAVALSGLVTAGALTMFLSQNQAIQSDEQRDAISHSSEFAFNSISRLLRHAITDTIEIDYGSGQLNDGIPQINGDQISISFSLPLNYPIWPNDGDPANQPWVLLSWSNTNDAGTPNAIMVATASTRAGLANAQRHTVIGSSSTQAAQSAISNFDLWPLNSNGNPQINSNLPGERGFLLSISSRSGQRDPFYQNPAYEPDDPLANFRSSTTTGVVAPRN